MNISREEAEPIIEKYIDREFEKIQKIDFPPMRSQVITEKSLVNEYINLRKGMDFKLTNICDSKYIAYFHKSIITASREGCDSPYEYWNKLKKDKVLFRKFYSNRLRCSDWFKEHDNMKYLYEGYVPDFIYGIGLTTSMTAPKVSTFSPKLAKMLIMKYLGSYSTIFDPFSGFSGRMLGALACGKKYIGQDLNEDHIEESKQMLKFIKDHNQTEDIQCELRTQDIFEDSKCEYECLFTCSPYGNKEKWNGDNDKNLSCDDWIDVCLEKYDCEAYLFVTDGDITKYKKYEVGELVNTSHFGTNKECILLIKKSEL